MHIFPQIDGSIREIARDIVAKGKAESNGISYFQDEFFSRVRAFLGVTVIGGNFWSQNHKKGSFVIYYQQKTGRKKEEIEEVKRKDYETFDDFLKQSSLPLGENERIPTRKDIEELRKDITARKESLSAFFLLGEKFIFDDAENGVGLFEVNQDTGVKILLPEEKSEVSHARVKTITKLGCNGKLCTS